MKNKTKVFQLVRANCTLLEICCLTGLSVRTVAAMIAAFHKLELELGKVSQ